MSHRDLAEAALRDLIRAESANDIIACALTSIAYSMLASQDGAIEATQVQLETQRKVQQSLEVILRTGESGDPS